MGRLKRLKELVTGSKGDELSQLTSDARKVLRQEKDRIDDILINKKNKPDVLRDYDEEMQALMSQKKRVRNAKDTYRDLQKDLLKEKGKSFLTRGALAAGTIIPAAKAIEGKGNKNINKEADNKDMDKAEKVFRKHANVKGKLINFLGKGKDIFSGKNIKDVSKSISSKEDMVQHLDKIRRTAVMQGKGDLAKQYGRAIKRNEEALPALKGKRNKEIAKTVGAYGTTGATGLGLLSD